MDLLLTKETTVRKIGNCFSVNFLFLFFSSLSIIFLYFLLWLLLGLKNSNKAHERNVTVSRMPCSKVLCLSRSLSIILREFAFPLRALNKQQQRQQLLQRGGGGSSFFMNEIFHDPPPKGKKVFRPTEGGIRAHPKRPGAEGAGPSEPSQTASKGFQYL